MNNEVIKQALNDAIFEIGEVKYRLSWDFCHKIEDAIPLSENSISQKDAEQYLDDFLLYYDNQWAMMQELQTPAEANYYAAYEEFYDIFMQIIDRFNENLSKIKNDSEVI